MCCEATWCRVCWHLTSTTNCFVPRHVMKFPDVFCAMKSSAIAFVRTSDALLIRSAIGTLARGHPYNGSHVKYCTSTKDTRVPQIQLIVFVSLRPSPNLDMWCFCAATGGFLAWTRHSFGPWAPHRDNAIGPSKLRFLCVSPAHSKHALTLKSVPSKSG